MEKWEDRKYFNFPPFCLVESEKVDGWKKKKKKFAKTYSHTLIKKWCPIKTKIWQTQEKKNHPNLLKNNNHVKKKKSRLVLQKKKKSNQITVNPHPKEKKRQSVPRKQKINKIK